MNSIQKADECLEKLEKIQTNKASRIHCIRGHISKIATRIAFIEEYPIDDKYNNFENLDFLVQDAYRDMEEIAKEAFRGES